MAKKVLPINVCEFAPDDGTHQANAYLMNKCPCVLSVGLRCNKGGFSYLWLSGKTPCLVTPDLKIIPLDVIGDIPYLKEGGLHAQNLSSEEVTALTGVMIDDEGRLVLDPDFLGAYVDAAAGEDSPSSQGGSSDKLPKGVKSKSGKDGDGVDLDTDGASTDAPPTGDDLSDDDSEGERATKVVRMSLKEKAATLRHRLTHKPALSDECDACMIGKTKNARKYKNRSE